MPDLEHLDVEVTSDVAADIRAAVADGDYATLSEAVGDALRDWRLRRQAETLETEALRRLIQEGIDSGPSLDGEDVLATLRTRYGVPPDR